MGSTAAAFFEILKSRPVIAGLRHAADVERAGRLGAGVLFILGEDIFALQESVAKAHAAGRTHPDAAAGG